MKVERGSWKEGSAALSKRANSGLALPTAAESKSMATVDGRNGMRARRGSEASAARVRIRIWVSIASAADVRRKGDAKMGGRRPVLVHMLKATQSEPHRTRGLVWESDLGRMSVK